MSPEIQESLFANVSRVSYQRHSQTSIQAAREIEPKVESIKKQVLAWFQICGAEGSTDDELAMAYPEYKPGTLRCRRIELTWDNKKRRDGPLVDSGRTRSNRSGRKMTVWVARQ
jgi:hypothetical protein